MLDRNNNFFRTTRVEGARLMEINGQADWRNASQVQTYFGRIYVADEGQNQIFRYNPAQPDADLIRGSARRRWSIVAGDFDGDRRLFGCSSATATSCATATEQLPFSLEAGAELAEEPVDLYVTKEERNGSTWRTQARTAYSSIPKTAYLRNNSAAEGDLRRLSGIYIEELNETLYILTKTGLYTHPLL